MRRRPSGAASEGSEGSGGEGARGERRPVQVETSDPAEVCQVLTDLPPLKRKPGGWHPAAKPWSRKETAEKPDLRELRKVTA